MTDLLEAAEALVGHVAYRNVDGELSWCVSPEHGKRLKKWNRVPRRCRGVLLTVWRIQE